MTDALGRRKRTFYLKVEEMPKNNNFWRSPTFRNKYQACLMRLGCGDWLVIDFTDVANQFDDIGALNSLVHIVFDADDRFANVGVIVKLNDALSLTRVALDKFVKVLYNKKHAYQCVPDLRRQLRLQPQGIS